MVRSSTRTGQTGASQGECPQRVRILHIIEQLGVGGAEKQLLGLLSRMDGNRFRHSIICFRDMPDSMGDRFRDLGIPVTCMHKHGQAIPRFFSRLSGEVRAARPDIVHTWLYSANFWGRWAALVARVPRVVASDRAEVERTCLLITLYERLLARRTVRLANSRAVADSLHRYYGLSEERIRVIYNGVSLPECDRAQVRSEIRAELGLPADQRIVMMLGRQTREKNYPMFLRAGYIICSRRSDVTFLAVGRQDCKEEIDRVRAEIGMPDRVRWIDAKPDVQRWLGAADVFCFTSNHEGFPNAVLEAMYAGLPVVCADFDSAHEVLEEGLSGIIVPRNDERVLAREVDALLDDPQRRAALGDRAGDRARALFSWGVLVERMEALYLSLAEAKSRSGRLAVSRGGLQP